MDEGGLWMGAVVLALGTVIIVTLIIQFTAAWKARATLAREDDYRKLAERTAAALAEYSDSRKQIERELATISAKLASIDKILHQIE